jgi:outer membrane protein OmpA-like peptidoglycan-associated protein
MPVAHILLLQSLLVASFTAPAGALDSRVQAEAASSQSVDRRAGVARTISDLLERGREIRFEAGTAKVAQSSLLFLQDLALALAQERAARLEIVVHTADSGDAKKDMTLSKRRAEAVKDVLVLKGANPDQLLPTGRGCEDPVAPNLTRTGRFRNERVELHRVSSPSRG